MNIRPPLASPSRIRRFFAGHAHRPAAGPHVFREQARRFDTAQTLIRAIYAFLLYLAITQFSELGGLAERATYAPLWPVAWLNWIGTGTGHRLLLSFYIATNVLGAFVPEWRAARLAVFLGLLEYVALKNSYGKIGHSLHLPLIVAGILVFLPHGWHRASEDAGRRLRQATLLVFWLAQAAVLMSYTMSGAAKFGAALWQIAHLQPNAFAPGALGAFIAQRLLQTHSASVLGAWIIRHPLLTWPLMPATIYVEMFAFWAAFRPAVARVWAAVLIVFHVGTFFTMTISFPQSCFLLAILFFASPFEPDNLHWQMVGFEVPLAGGLWKKWKSRPRAHDVIEGAPVDARRGTMSSTPPAAQGD